MPVIKVHLNKRIIWATALGVVAVAFSLWYTATPSVKGDKERNKLAEIARAKAEEKRVALALDSDNDGLKDWEELIAGTDPKNPDTNGDGISDLETVKKIRSQKEMGMSASTSTSSKQTEGKVEQNLTEETTRKIFGAYIRAKLSDTYNPNSFTKVVDGVAEQVFNSPETADKYSAKDIKIKVNANENSVRNYRKASDKAIAPVIEIQEYELTTYARAIETKSEEEFAKLTTAADAYRMSATNLLVVPVPQDALEMHLRLVNAFDSFADTLESMGKGIGDPILSHVQMKDFLDKEKRINDVFDSMRIYFSLKYGIKIK